jgi:peptidoglycan L-alanyl-D-glutamate endopeptidase CwlK
MRDIKQCHPKLQKLAKKLIKKCAAQGIKIKIGECLRSIGEQDALYAKGRTIAPIGHTVTNARGCTYSSMHQWGIAFDFYLDMDVDKDGKKSDDAFNDDTRLFEKVGEIGKKIGLEWGGGWTSIKDRPHFQLPDWGSTPYKLKLRYGYPDKFIKTWK